MRKPLIVKAAILAAIIAFGSGGYALELAQIRTEPIDPVVLSGGDVGFRMVGRQRDKPVGVWVVRIDGKWVATASPWDVRPGSK
jgi:hypothetical protein